MAADAPTDPEVAGAIGALAPSVKGDKGKKGKDKREREPKAPKEPKPRKPGNFGAIALSLPAIILGVIGSLLFGAGLLMHQVLPLGGGVAALGAAAIAFVLPIEQHKLSIAHLSPLFALWIAGIAGLSQIAKW